METRYETFTILMTRILRMIKHLKTEEMAAYNLKGIHVTCLHYLYRFSPLTAAELCERCDEDKSAVSRALNYLEENGFLFCEPGSSRKYKSTIILTDQGMAAGKLISEKINTLVEEASHDLPEEDRTVLYRALQTISDNLENISRREETGKEK